MTLGQNYDIPQGHKQPLCEVETSVFSLSDLELAKMTTNITIITHLQIINNVFVKLYYLMFVHYTDKGRT